MTREEAIGRILDHERIHSKKEPFTPYLDKAFTMAIKALKEQRPHGEWITKGAVGDGTWCSVCDTNIKLFPNRYSFCPNCGADMRPKILDQAVDIIEWLKQKREGDSDA